MSELNLNWVKENFTEKKAVIFDIGCASMCDTIAIKLLLPDSTCYAFECNKEWQNTNCNNAVERGIYYFHCAFTDIDGYTMFYPSDKNKGENWPYSGSTCQPLNTLPHKHLTWADPYTVFTTKFDTFCNRFNVSPSFVHIDVQGAEYKVLSHLGKYRPLAIWTEVCEFNNYNTHVNHTDFNNLLLSYGYDLVHSEVSDELYVLRGSNLTPYD
jgi:FkbM family methyltransferase